MNNEIQDLYRDKDYCFKEIGNIRAAIGSKEATQKIFDNAIKSLGFMALYCPAEIIPIVHSQLSETEMRLTYFMTKDLRKSL